MLGNSVVMMVSVFPGCGNVIRSWTVKMDPMNVTVVFNILCSRVLFDCVLVDYNTRQLLQCLTCISTTLYKKCVTNKHMRIL